MNATIQFIIAVLISLGILLSENDWNNLSEQEKTEYKQQIVIDETASI